MAHERDKYRAMWGHPPYRNYSPGESYLDVALQALNPPAQSSFIDFGCGTGRAAAKLIERGHSVLGIDIADNCRDPGMAFPFLVADLSVLPDLSADYGLCTDVMEHIPTHLVDDVLAGIDRSVKRGVFFSIALFADAFGSVIGMPLHLTVKDMDWWDAKLSHYWPVVRTRVEGGNLLAACLKPPGGFVVDAPVTALCNTAETIIRANIAANSRRDVPWIDPVEAHDRVAVICGGGPSLLADIPEIAARQKSGQEIFALNGAGNFLLAHGIIADSLIVIDPREQNIKFLGINYNTAKRFILASQCHPILFDRADPQALLFHAPLEGLFDELPRQGTMIGGGITSGLTALPLLFTMGYRDIHLFGYDSSHADDGAVHAYAQAETDPERKRLEIWCAGRKFITSFAMFKQAENFEGLARMLADAGAVIHVHGSGLLPTIAHEMVGNDHSLTAKEQS